MRDGSEQSGREGKVTGGGAAGHSGNAHRQGHEGGSRGVKSSVPFKRGRKESRLFVFLLRCIRQKKLVPSKPPRDRGAPRTVPRVPPPSLPRLPQHLPRPEAAGHFAAEPQPGRRRRPIIGENASSAPPVTAEWRPRHACVYLGE